MDLFDFLLDPLSYDFMVRALVTTALAAIVCAVLSCWLVLIGWSLMGDAVSHAVLPGVVLAYVVGRPVRHRGAGLRAARGHPDRGGPRHQPGQGGRGDRRSSSPRCSPSGLVLISVTPSQTDLNHIIFGNLLGVSVPDLHPGAGPGRGGLRHPDPQAPRPHAVRLRPHARPRDRARPRDGSGRCCWVCWR